MILRHYFGTLSEYSCSSWMLRVKSATNSFNHTDVIVIPDFLQSGRNRYQ